MTIGAFLIGEEDKSFFYKFLIIITEPAGWFLFWEGLNFLFITPDEKLPNYHFYRKMSKAEICFLDY